MSITQTLVDRTVWGNKYLMVYKVTADGNASALVSGFKVLDYAWAVPNSCTSLGINLKINCTNTTASIGGSIKLNAMTSGDNYYVYCIGQ